MGSAGLFLLRGLYIFDLPQWPLRLLGSSIPEWGTAAQANPVLNPITASVLVSPGATGATVVPSILEVVRHRLNLGGGSLFRRKCHIRSRVFVDRYDSMGESLSRD